MPSQSEKREMPMITPLKNSRATSVRKVAAVALQAQPDVNSVILPKTGLNLPRTMSFNKWVDIGRVLSAAQSSSAWCLGDWLIYGELAYTGRYRDAIEQTSLDYQTLRNYAWVARRFTLPRRRQSLSFGHHAEVASLAEPEQEYWLRKAEDLDWSRNFLRREVRASLRERAVADKQKPDADDVSHEQMSLQLEITSEQFELCNHAASAAGLSVEEWAVLTLGQAARVALSPAAFPGTTTY